MPHGPKGERRFGACRNDRRKVAEAGSARPSNAEDRRRKARRTFLRNHADAIVAIDLCVVPTISFECLFAFLVIDPWSKTVAMDRGHAAPDGRMAGAADGGGLAVRRRRRLYLIRDNDGAFGQVVTNRVRRMEIRDRPISPRSPWQNPHVERLIATLRRDCLDHVLIFGEQHLRQILTFYSRYYNEARTHLGLRKDTPRQRPVQRNGTIIATPILSGLHHRYARI